MDDPKVRRYSGVYMRKEGNSRDSAAMGVDLDCGPGLHGPAPHERKRASGLESTEKALKRHLKSTS